MDALALGNDWEFVRDMTEFSTTTGQQEPKSGLVLTGFLSLTRTGAAIHSSLSVPLVETSVVGRYAASILGTDMVTQLTSILGANRSIVIYDRCTGAGYSDYEPIRLTTGRQAGE